MTGSGVRSDSFRQLQRMVNGWQALQFGKGKAVGSANHLKREVDELCKSLESGDSGSAAEEVADCAFMVLAVAGELGIDLFSEILRKFTVNICRTWGEPEADGAILHVDDGKP